MSLSIPAELVSLFRSARRVAVLTGAGVSAESGVPAPHLTLQTLALVLRFQPLDWERWANSQFFVPR